LKLGIIGVPSSVGSRAIGLEGGPTAFREARFVETLIENGHEAVDFGNTESFKYQPDPTSPKAQNKPLVTKVCKLVAEKVEMVMRQSFQPIVLGGDCSIAIGTLAGITNLHPNIGLIYMDGDADLNTPETTPSGIFDGMVVAHLIGKGAKELSHIGKRYPILKEENVALFGLNLSTGFVDPPEIKYLQTSPIVQFPTTAIREIGAESAATQILGILKPKVRKIFVHFDVDTIDSAEMPAKDLPHPNGLSFNDVAKALRIFATDDSFLGIEITEFNPDKDPGHQYAKMITELVTTSLG